MPFSRSPSKAIRQGMDRLRRSFRESFRRKSSKEETEPTFKLDEAAVRAGTCSFNVKYLGCVEVFESRGMQVCEEALKVLRQQKRRPVKTILYVSGDGLRVVDADNKGLVVDQTIEKVSFCAPDRQNERGFAYICRDGTSRRWMCHGFHAQKETGERLSHAVGCAFAVCLEKKQKRDREAAEAIAGTSTFSRQGSFRHATLTERMADPQNVIPSPEKPQPRSVVPVTAVARPRASLRLSSEQSAPFKRGFSLRLNELPSNLSRTRGPEAPIPEEQQQMGKSKAEAWLEATLSQRAQQQQFEQSPFLRDQLTPPTLEQQEQPHPQQQEVDIFGQPVFVRHQAKPKLNPQIRSQSLTTEASASFDPFEAKWRALDARKNYNPFEAESQGVDV